MTEGPLILVNVGCEVLAGPGAGALAADLAELKRRGARLVVVHSGGPQATELQKRMGLEPKQVGGRRVTVMGHDVVSDYAAARKALGIVPQELVFDPFFSVRETLRIQSGYFGVKGNDAWIDELLENLGLADKANANMRGVSAKTMRRMSASTIDSPAAEKRPCGVSMPVTSRASSRMAAPSLRSTVGKARTKVAPPRPTKLRAMVCGRSATAKGSARVMRTSCSRL